MRKQTHYYALNDYLLEQYGEKIYKLSLDGGMTCPNRDGTLGTRGCIFCSEGGSGEFAERPYFSVEKQIENAKIKVRSKTKGTKFIAYFQSFTNTYAPVEYLRDIFMQAIKQEDIVVLAIATRPDCLSQEVLKLLQSLNEIKPVWIELGLQTIHEKSAEYIRRGYALPCFNEAVNQLKAIGVKIIVHTIIGLPGEGIQEILQTIQYLGRSGIDGIKLQLLHVLKGTDLADDFSKKRFATLSLEEYIEIVIQCIEHLPPDIVIHRLTGDGPKSLLIAPRWSANKKHVLNSINKMLEERAVSQGKFYSESR